MTHYRKCPNCGWQDPVAWRGSKFNVDWEVADFDEFRAAYPDIANQFRGVGEHYLIKDDEYVYWRQSGQNQHLIHRIPLVIYKTNGNHCRGRGAYQESRRARAASANMKLTELEAT
jgi:hypothetical protein